MSASASASASASDEVECAICLTSDIKMPYRLVNCRHVFCKTCLLEKRRVTEDPRCPQCRRISFIAVSINKMGHIDLGHSPDATRVSNLNISQKDIADAMVCMHCFSRDHPARMFQCNTCRGLWHSFCLIVPLDETRDEKGSPIVWTCTGCTAKLRSKAGSNAISARFAQAARERRAQNVRTDEAMSQLNGGGGGGVDKRITKHFTKKRQFSTDKEQKDAAYNGHNLGNRSARSFFKAKRTSSSSLAAAVPRASGERDAVDDNDGDFDEEFADSVADADQDL
jgi:hypothetical protein